MLGYAEYAEIDSEIAARKPEYEIATVADLDKETTIYRVSIKHPIAGTAYAFTLIDVQDFTASKDADEYVSTHPLS